MRSFSAKDRLPDIFDKSVNEQQAIFSAIAEKIKHAPRIGKIFDENRPLLMPDGSPNNSEKPYSIFCFEDDDGHPHYFLVPRKRGRVDRKLINLLGKGAEGQVIPGYELIPRDDSWYIDPTDVPSIAIKIIAKPHLSEDRFHQMVGEYIRQAQVTNLASDKLKVFPQPIPRKIDRENKKVDKIYIGMTYIPGKSGLAFCEKHKTHIRKKKSKWQKFQKEQYYLEHFYKALKYSISLIQELEHLNKYKILHRDIKPGNLILNEEKLTTTLVDYGYAETEENAQKELGYCGTDVFIAPELHLRKAKHSPNTEKYSLGLTLYQIFGGKEKIPNFSSMIKHLGEIYAHARRGAKRVSKNFLKHVPVHPEKKGLIRKAIQNLLQEDPSERTASLSEIRELFEKIRDEVGVELWNNENASKEKPEFSTLWNYLETMPLNPSPLLTASTTEPLSEPTPQPSISTGLDNSATHIVKSADTEPKGKEEEDSERESPSEKLDSKIQDDENVEKKAEKNPLDLELKNINDLYLQAYKGDHKKELGSMPIGFQQIDQVNFLYHIISHPEFNIIDDTKNLILARLSTYFNIAESEENKLEALKNKIDAENAKTTFVTRWQYFRIIREYINYKEERLWKVSFFEKFPSWGMRWFAQSRASEKAIEKALNAQSPEERGSALIQHYYKAQNRWPFFKANKDRALGKAIEKICPESPSIAA